MRGKTHNCRRRLRKQHKRSRKVQRAGAYIYSGTYGCAFGNPPLKCVGEASRRGNDTISKALERSTGRQEIYTSEKFRTIDPDNRYFLWPEKLCELDTADIRPEDEVDKCPKIHDPDPTEQFTHLLLSKNGGTNLGHIQLKYDDYYSFFESLLNLFDGLHLAHTNNVAHCDIKPANIVSMRLPDGRFATRYIDFGLSMNLDPMPTSFAMGTFSSLYTYWPAEIYYYYRTSISDVDKINTRLLGFYQNLRTYTGNAIPQKSYFNTDGTNRFEGMGLKGVLGTLDLTERDEAPKRVDIYSLGISLAQVYYRFLGHIVKYKPDGSQYVEIPIKLPLATEPNFHEIIDWHIQVQNRISIPLADMIYKMIHIHPRRRPTPLAAKAEFEAILPAMQELFTKANLYKCLKPTGILGFIPNVPTPTPVPTPPSPTNISKIQVSPVPNRVRPRRDPRMVAAAPAAPARPLTNENLMAFFNNVEPFASNENLSYMYESN